MEAAADLVARSSVDHRETVPQRSRQKSRVANGSALLAGVDGRSPWVHRAKEIIADHISDLGGVDNCSAAERSIIRRASTLTVELERLEARFATAGEADTADLETYQRCANSLRRLLGAVGLQRRPKDIGPGLSDLMRMDLEDQRQEEAARAAGDSETLTSDRLCGLEERPASEEADA